MIVAIDGPCGAGKSTIAKEVAKTLHFSCLDTGAMYRAIAWYALEHNINLANQQDLAKIAQYQEISFGHNPGNPLPSRVFISGIEITDDIRTSRIDKSVSAVASVASVRSALVGQQQRIASEGNYVIEGRDIGTTVFPHAEVKVFLTASDEERAQRRVQQNLDRGIGSVSYEEVLADLKRRDQADKTREISPLCKAEDAYLLDSTGVSIEDVITKICDLALESGAENYR